MIQVILHVFKCYARPLSIRATQEWLYSLWDRFLFDLVFGSDSGPDSVKPHANMKIIVRWKYPWSPSGREDNPTFHGFIAL